MRNELLRQYEKYIEMEISEKIFFIRLAYYSAKEEHRPSYHEI